MQLKAILLIGAVATALVGCKPPEPGEAPGPEAKTQKTYTKEDALAIKPKRAGSEGNAPATVAPEDVEKGR